MKARKIFYLVAFLMCSTLVFAAASPKRITVSEDELSFSANEDYTEVTIRKFTGDINKYADAIMVIPAEIQGVPVTVIDEYAFDNNYLEWHYGEVRKTIKELVIPESVKYIRNHAFSRMDFECINLPSGLKFLGNYAFADNSKLKSFTLKPSSATYGFDIFEGCKALEKLVIEEGVTQIGISMFTKCGIKSLTIPKSLKIIPPGAFSACPLEELILQEGLEEIYFSAFASNEFSFTTRAEFFRDYEPYEDYYSLELKSGKAYFNASTGEYIFSYNGLVYIPHNRPRDRYDENYFTSQDNSIVHLKKLTFPKSLKYISVSAFSNCIIDEIEIPEGAVYYSEIDGSLYDIIDERSCEKSFAYQKKLKGIKIIDYIAEEERLAKEAEEERLAKEEEERIRLEEERIRLEEEKKAYEERVTKALPAYLNKLSESRYITQLSTKETVVLVQFRTDRNGFIKDPLFVDNNGTIDITLENLTKRMNSNSLSGQTYFESKDPICIYRYASSEEKDFYLEELRKAAFKKGSLHTNLYNKDYKYMDGTYFEVKDGRVIIYDIDKDTFGAKSGLMKKDLVKSITLIDKSGSKQILSYQDLNSVPGNTQLIFTVERGKGKKAQTLDISIQVEWNVQELQKLNLMTL